MNEIALPLKRVGFEGENNDAKGTYNRANGELYTGSIDESTAQNRRMTIRATLNGHNAVALIDSGCSAVVVSRRLVSRLGGWLKSSRLKRRSGCKKIDYH